VLDLSNPADLDKFVYWLKHLASLQSRWGLEPVVDRLRAGDVTDNYRKPKGRPPKGKTTHD